MGKVDANKRKKRGALLDSAFQLFIDNGFSKTSISDIVSRAGVAKGTFYLYFSDKYDIRNKLIAHKASQVFLSAYHSMLEHGVSDFEEQVLFIIDHILNQLSEDMSLVRFISKHLSWAFFKNSLLEAENENHENVFDIYMQLLNHSGIQFREPEIMIYLIIELVSGASYNAILYQQPVPLEELKPYLYEHVRDIIRREKI